MGNLVTFAAGFLLASNGKIDFFLFFSTLLGLAFIMASGCVFNNYIDRKIDKQMDRTKNRPLVTGLISHKNAIIFAVGLVILGNLILAFYTNALALLIADIGFFVYVILYSFWKCRTVYGTAIGSIAGAIPPVVGYCAVSHQFDSGALILFLMLVLWQMPHFFSIAIYRLDDYASVAMPVLPVSKGMQVTKIHMLLYIMAFIVTSLLLTVAGYTGYMYGIIAACLGASWLVLCINGFRIEASQDKQWARRMFRLSLVVTLGICAAIPFDLV
jgi:protoheme IX farnesyltransferase